MSGAPGVYPIEAPTRRLAAMLAVAGGVALEPEVAQVQIERGGRSGTIWLQDLYDNPGLDVALRGDDRIIVEQDRRSFTALGATTAQARVPFNNATCRRSRRSRQPAALTAAPPTRPAFSSSARNPPRLRARVLGCPGLAGPQRMVYLLDLTRPEGLFAARDFVIRDEDTVYITEAPFASWTRVLQVATSAVNVTGSVAAISSR